MASPTQLNATEQDTLVKQIGLSLLRAAPRDWRRVTVDYRAVGRYHELTGEVDLSDGTTQEWIATHDIASLFGRLRTGMYREGRGTWFNARYQLDHPSSYNLEYDRDEPVWDLAPPPQAYADELRMFPRKEENVPDWLMRRMAGLAPERPGPRFRMARVFDGAGAGGRPVVNRPELDDEEQDRVLDYLDSAPVVVPGRGYDLDRLANTTESTVPVAFHSDGTWIWPAAVNYYLRQYGVAPDPELVAHIRADGFVIPDVPDNVRQAAAAHVSRGAPPPKRPATPKPATPPSAEPPPPAPEDVDEHNRRQKAAEGAAEPPQRFAPEIPERDPDRTQLAAPVVLSKPPQDYADEPHEQPPQEPHFIAHDAEQTRITAAPQFDESIEAGTDEEFAQREYDVQDRTDQEYTDRGYADHSHADGDYAEDAYAGQDYAGQDYADGYDEAERRTSHSEDHYDERRFDHSADHEDVHEDVREDARARMEHPVEQATTYTPVPQIKHGPPTTITPPPVAGRPQPTAQPGPPLPPALPAREVRQDQQRPLPEPVNQQRTDEQPGAAADGYDDGGPPTQHSAGPLVYDEPVFEELQDRLTELGVPTSAYRIGEPARRGWALEEAAEGWRVGWYEDEQLTSPAVFGDAEDAAAFMLGKLLLAPEGFAGPGMLPEVRPPRAPTPQKPPRHGSRPQDEAAEERGPAQRPATLPQDRPVPPQPVTTTLSADVATGSRPPTAPEPLREEASLPQRPQGAARRDAARSASEPAAHHQNGQATRGGKGNQQWPVLPLPGEPPLTLFRGKEMRDLPMGSEVDRFGGPNGNLTYAAGTPFEERSLVPEWVNRPYHVYRVQRPLRVLAGVAIPWFNQPGGGAAYLLPASIDELLTDGDLIELEPGEPPVD